MAQAEDTSGVGMKSAWTRNVLGDMWFVARLTTSVLMVAAGISIAQGQGTITFDAHAYWSGTSYTEQGIVFTVMSTTPGSVDDMGISPAITSPWNTPYNGSPYMMFIRQSSVDDYVILSSANHSSFGLASVMLADAAAPSLTPMAISFQGLKTDGSMVSETFVTPGNGADHLLLYQFNSDFASGLTSVEILAPRWAMDDLVFAVPEPGTAGLVLLGLFAYGVRTIRARRR